MPNIITYPTGSNMPTGPALPVPTAGTEFYAVLKYNGATAQAVSCPTGPLLLMMDSQNYYLVRPDKITKQLPDQTTYVATSMPRPPPAQVPTGAVFVSGIATGPIGP